MVIIVGCVSTNNITPHQEYKSVALAAPLVADNNFVLIERCFANSTTGKDRIDLMRWMYAALGSYPELIDISAVSSVKQEEINKAAGALFERLLINECGKEVKEVIKSANSNMFMALLRPLVKLSARESFNNPVVGANLAVVTNSLNLETLQKYKGTTFATPSFAGSNFELLERCFANSTTGKNRIDLMRWMYAAIASHPELIDISAVSSVKQEEINKAAGALFERLLINECSKEVKVIIQSDDRKAFTAAFKSLMKLSMQELIGPVAEENIAGIMKFVDPKKLNALAE
jgi:hypothetical protein